MRTDGFGITQSTRLPGARKMGTKKRIIGPRSGFLKDDYARILASIITIFIAATGFSVYHYTHASINIRDATTDTILMISTTVDCSKAQSYADRLICHDPELAYDENRIEETLSTAKADAQSQDDFRLSVADDWGSRETCRNKPCLIAWYARENSWIERVKDTGQVGY
jgi:hypothetical protein